MVRIVSALALAAIAFAGGAAPAAERTVTLVVDNMYCDACPYIVKQTLSRVPGVGTVVVSYEQKTATVTYDDEGTTIEALTSATMDAGYPSRPAP